MGNGDTMRFTYSVPMSDTHLGSSLRSGTMGDDWAKCIKNPGMRVLFHGDLPPTQAKEATPMHTLYTVTLIDSAGNIELDRKVVAKGPEAAKLKAGVYGWCEEHCQTLDDVTVLVFALGQVKAGA